MILTEWEQRRAEPLPQRAAELLRERHGREIGVTPAWDAPGCYDLDVHGYIGAIALPDLPIILRPKVPLNTVVYLLSETETLPALAEELSPFAEDELTSVVARWFVGAAAPLIERHLVRRYRVHEEDTTFVRGKIEVAGSVRLQLASRPELVCRFDEHTPDLVENQVLLATTQLLLHTPGVADELNARLHRMAAMLAEVQPRVPPRWERSAVVFDRLNAPYRPALRLAEWILDRASPEFFATKQTARFQAFLIDMSDLFQRFVFLALSRRLEARGYRCFSESRAYIDTRRQLFETRPDMLVRAPDGRVVVLDMKYKRLTEHYGPSEADVYQVVTYCLTRGARHGLLVYPTSEVDAQSSTEIVNAGISLTFYPVELGRGRTELNASLDQLAEYVVHCFTPSASA